jgi:hypothetical protein
MVRVSSHNKLWTGWLGFPFTTNSQQAFDWMVRVSFTTNSQQVFDWMVRVSSTTEA